MLTWMFLMAGLVLHRALKELSLDHTEGLSWYGLRDLPESRVFGMSRLQGYLSLATWLLVVQGSVS